MIYYYIDETDEEKFKSAERIIKSDIKEKIGCEANEENCKNVKIKDIKKMIKNPEKFKGGNLIIDDLSSLGHTVYAMTKWLLELSKLNMQIFFKSNGIEVSNLNYLILGEMLRVEKKFISQRIAGTKNTKKKQKETFKQKGKVQFKSMYDKYKKRILKLNSQKMSNAKILEILKSKDEKLSGGTTQSLGQYIKKLKEKELENSKNEIYWKTAPEKPISFGLKFSILYPDGTMNHIEKKPKDITIEEELVKEKNTLSDAEPIEEIQTVTAE